MAKSETANLVLYAAFWPQRSGRLSFDTAGQFGGSLDTCDAAYIHFRTADEATWAARDVVNVLALNVWWSNHGTINVEFLLHDVHSIRGTQLSLAATLLKRLNARIPKRLFEEDAVSYLANVMRAAGVREATNYPSNDTVPIHKLCRVAGDFIEASIKQMQARKAA